MAIQTPYSNIPTLVIDDMPTQQTTLRGQLQMLHIQKVDVATTPDDAIRLIRQRPYGLVICDFNLNQKTDGQQLLEYLRDSGLLAPDCLFFMVTAENTYGSVASTSEHRPDAYLLKPITAGDVEDRLKSLLDRRNAMQPVNQRLAKGDLAGAVAACDAILAKKGRWAMQALQLKGQALLQMGRPAEAAAVYRQALSVNESVVWAQLGLAKALEAGGDIDQALRLAEVLIGSRDGEKNVDAYDFAASCLEARGDMAGALGLMKDLATVVPSPRRQRIVGEAAYRNGDLETARECYSRVAQATKGTIAAKAQDAIALAQVLIDTGDFAAAVSVIEAGAKAFPGHWQFAVAAPALRAQIQARSGDVAAAGTSLVRARQGGRRSRADFSTFVLAKAELMTGNEEAGLQLLESSVTDHHRDPRTQQLVGQTLTQTGHADKFRRVVEAGVVAHHIAAARALFGDGQADRALAAIETALADYPDNAEALLQAAQMSCVTLRERRRTDAAFVQRVRGYLARLDRLMPGHERVARMHAYHRETIAELEGGSVVPHRA